MKQTKHFCDRCNQELKHNDIQYGVLGFIIPKIRSLAHPKVPYHFCKPCYDEVWEIIQRKK